MANGIPPSISPSKHFSSMQREVFGCLIQCRTNHSYTGEFCHRFFPEEDFSCPCSKEFQTREHILVHCPIHKHKQKLLCKVSTYIITYGFPSSSAQKRASLPSLTSSKKQQCSHAPTSSPRNPHSCRSLTNLKPTTPKTCYHDTSHTYPPFNINYYFLFFSFLSSPSTPSTTIECPWTTSQNTPALPH